MSMKLLIAADVEDGKANAASVPAANGTKIHVVTLRNYRTATRGFSATEVWSTERARENPEVLADALACAQICLAPDGPA